MVEEVRAEIIDTQIEVSCTAAVIADNLDVLSAWVDRQIAPYIGAVIDPEDERQVKECRKCMADLNKLKAPIESERKRVKREYEAPLKAFEARVKDVTAKIDGARAAIKAQVDAADEAFRANRLDALHQEYADTVGVLAEVIPFSAIAEDRWLTRSVPYPKAASEMADKAAKALEGYETLQKKELAHKDEVVKRYADTLDMVAALKLEDELNERDRQMAEFKEAQEAARAIKEERSDPAPQEPAQGPERYLWSLSMEFEGTKAFAEAVAAVLKSNGLTGATIKCKGAING